jgi:hypothetical protein
VVRAACRGLKSPPTSLTPPITQAARSIPKYIDPEQTLLRQWLHVMEYLLINLLFLKCEQDLRMQVR